MLRECVALNLSGNDEFDIRWNLWMNGDTYQLLLLWSIMWLKGSVAEL